MENKFKNGRGHLNCDILEMFSILLTHVVLSGQYICNNKNTRDEQIRKKDHRGKSQLEIPISLLVWINQHLTQNSLVISAPLSNRFFKTCIRAVISQFISS